MKKKFERNLIFEMNLTFFLFFGFAFLLNSCEARDKSQNPQKIYLRAVEEYTLHNFQGASEFCKAAIKLDGGFYQAKFLEGKINFFSAEYDKAYEIFCRLSKKYPQYTDARLWKIRTLLMLEKLDEAKNLLEQEISFNGTDWRVFYLYSLCCRQEESLDLELVMLGNAETALKDSVKVYEALQKNWKLLGMENKTKFYQEKKEILRK